MKFTKIVTVALAVASLSISVFAQRSFDTYSAPRTLVLSQPVLYSGGAAFTSGTNAWVDIRSFDGIAKVDVFGCTNVSNSSFTITIQTSTDQTNLTTLLNVSAATATSYIYTNFYYGGGSNCITATNTWNLPGAPTVPTANTAGWATPYLNAVANPFTNTISAYSPAQDGITTLGVSIGDAPRYARLIVSLSGAATNCVVGADITGYVHSSSYPF